eukprot:TRINITY_DN9360_c2_g4_i1.p1 TRINITY_DN9360_c2_g4~~TRINITY_DN9360_c2_g4_i1.p1  ORF type:complete len:404 (-),score=49.39 TRINITY_DN9360_c2_g4_i1:403-1614(-)
MTLTESELDDATADKVTGIVVSACSALFYASGLCVQRAALTMDGPNGPAFGCDRRFCRKHPKLIWTIGLMIYGVGGMFLGTIALRYVPLSLTSSIFSTVLLFNAFVARLWLKEEVSHIDFVCYVLIIIGITIDSYYLPDSPTQIDVQELSRLWHQGIGIFFFIVVLSVLVVLTILILAWLERKHETAEGYDPRHKFVYKLAMVSYPVVLGICEGVAYMCLKAGNDLFSHLAAGRQDQLEHWLFWFGCGISLPMILFILMWVHKAYARFPTTQIFPLELGALTIVSVNGGLLFFEEYKGCEPHELGLIYAGVALMISSMVTITCCKTTQVDDLSGLAHDASKAATISMDADVEKREEGNADIGDQLPGALPASECAQGTPTLPSPPFASPSVSAQPSSASKRHL